MPGLSISTAEVDEAEEARRERPGGRRRGDGRVCMCGHPFNRHTAIRGTVVCQPSRMKCGCKEQVAALEVQNTRMFLRKTVGVGVGHALTLGIRAAVEAGSEIRWVVPTTCFKCGSGEVSPVGFKLGVDGIRKVVSDQDSPERTRLLCGECEREFE